MRKIIIAWILITLMGCKNNADKADPLQKNVSVETSSEEVPVPDSTSKNDCKASETLLFEDDNIKSYTQNEFYGSDIVEFDLQPGNTLSILNEDNSVFGEITAKADLTFESLLPSKIIARKLIINSDFTSFIFDAEPIASDKDFVIIYINKAKKKVEKAQAKFLFKTWEAYLSEQTLQLNDCNLLRVSQKQILRLTATFNFDVLEVSGDSALVRSSEDCIEDEAIYSNMQGWIQWKGGNRLLVNFAICN